MPVTYDLAFEQLFCFVVINQPSIDTIIPRQSRPWDLSHTHGTVYMICLGKYFLLTIFYFC